MREEMKVKTDDSWTDYRLTRKVDGDTMTTVFFLFFVNARIFFVLKIVSLNILWIFYVTYYVHVLLNEIFFFI